MKVFEGICHKPSPSAASRACSPHVKGMDTVVSGLEMGQHEGTI